MPQYCTGSSLFLAGISLLESPKSDNFFQSNTHLFIILIIVQVVCWSPRFHGCIAWELQERQDGAHCWEFLQIHNFKCYSLYCKLSTYICQGPECANKS